MRAQYLTTTRDDAHGLAERCSERERTKRDVCSRGQRGRRRWISYASRHMTTLTACYYGASRLRVTAPARHGQRV